MCVSTVKMRISFEQTINIHSIVLMVILQNIAGLPRVCQQFVIVVFPDHTYLLLSCSHCVTRLEFRPYCLFVENIAVVPCDSVLAFHCLNLFSSG